ncbi:hypothetical protein GCM10010298_69540 [Streptomyces microflavus]|nr:hypothetical protein GCM10010298_69540 [Streptomyces microflavus]
MPRPAAAVPAALDLETTDVDDGHGLVLDDLTREQVRTTGGAWAVQDHQIVFDYIDCCSESAVRRLFSNQLIELGHFRLGHLELGCPTGGRHEWRRGRSTSTSPAKPCSPTGKRRGRTAPPARSRSGAPAPLYSMTGRESLGLGSERSTG